MRNDAAMSVKRPMGMNSDVLKINAAQVSPIYGSHCRIVISRCAIGFPPSCFTHPQISARLYARTERCGAATQNATVYCVFERKLGAEKTVNRRRFATRPFSAANGITFVAMADSKPSTIKGVGGANKETTTGNPAAVGMTRAPYG